MAVGKRKRRLTFRRKRSLDPNLLIEYTNPDTLKRFVTDRGKIIPRRISGATQAQQRAIAVAVKRARYLALIPTCVAHRTERGFAGEMAAVGAMMSRSSYRPSGPRGDQPRDNRDSASTESQSSSEAPKTEASAPANEE